MARKRKTPPTKAELKLLAFPPGQDTWLCEQTVAVVRFGKTVQQQCGLNNGKNDRCWICACKRPERPKLVWPQYVTACKKVGREPEDRLGWSTAIALKEAGDDPDTSKRRPVTKRVTRRK